MYTDYENYPHLRKLPSDLESALEKLAENKELNDAFGEKIITSYVKLKNNEINNFNSKENFSKEEPITDWEKLNTLDC
jgi:glutamine synthetase